MNAHFWLHWLIAPFAGFWLGRVLGMRREAAWAVGVIYVTSGFYMATLNLYNLAAPVALAPALLAAGLAMAGCAKKSYVHREVGEVNQKVDAVSAEVEKTQERVRQNEVEIAKVDKESRAGIAEANASASAAMDKATDAERAAKGKLVYSRTLSNDKVQFSSSKSQLSEEAQAMIDDTIGPLVQENAGVLFELEGHTDSTAEECTTFCGARRRPSPSVIT